MTKLEAKPVPRLNRKQRRMLDAAAKKVAKRYKAKLQSGEMTYSDYAKEAYLEAFH